MLIFEVYSHFLSKNGAGILACLLISIVSWFLGGFFPVVGAPVFAILLNAPPPWLSPYKQLDAGLALVPRNCPVCRYLTRFWSQYLASLCSWTNFTPRHPFHHFDFLNRCLPLPAFLCARTQKLATLIGVGSSICGGSAIAATAPLSMPRKKKSPKPSPLSFFFNVLAALYLSNARNLASPIQ